MPGLFSEFILKDLHLKNRIVMPPMCMYMAEDGLANEWHLVHYATRAVGQAGLVIVEATAVSPEGRISADDLGIWRDDQIPGLKRIADAIHREGGKIGIQLAHAGRKSGVPGVQIISSTADRFSKDYEVPHEMDEEDIRRITSAFGQSAKRALEAGFDLIEIHGAHGYLINQFLSPLVNRREDGYGVLLKIAVVSSVRLLQRYGENGRMKSPWEFAYPPRSMPRAGIHLMMSRHC